MRTLPVALCFLSLLATSVSGCKLPYSTRPQVLVVPYRNLLPDTSTGQTSGAQTCFKAPLTDLPVPPEAVQFQVKSAVFRLELRNEGNARLQVYPYLSERGVDAYAGTGLAPDETLDLTTRGTRLERTLTLPPTLFRASMWSFGLRLATPTPFEPRTREPGEQLEVRWQVQVDAAIL